MNPPRRRPSTSIDDREVRRPEAVAVDWLAQAAAEGERDVVLSQRVEQEPGDEIDTPRGERRSVAPTLAGTAVEPDANVGPRRHDYACPALHRRAVGEERVRPELGVSERLLLRGESGRKRRGDEDR